MKQIIGLAISSIWSAPKGKKQALHTNQRGEVPCKTCQFFNKNPYLKCAVQPHLTLSRQAFDCSDYLPSKGSHSLLSELPTVSATVFDPQTQTWYRVDNFFARSKTV